MVGRWSEGGGEAGAQARGKTLRQDCAMHLTPNHFSRRMICDFFGQVGDGISLFGFYRWFSFFQIVPTSLHLNARHLFQISGFNKILFLLRVRESSRIMSLNFSFLRAVRLEGERKGVQRTNTSARFLQYCTQPHPSFDTYSGDEINNRYLSDTYSGDEINKCSHSLLLPQGTDFVSSG